MAPATSKAATAMPVRPASVRRGRRRATARHYSEARDVACGTIAAGRRSVSGRPLACLLTTIGLLVAPSVPVRAAGPWSQIRSEHFLFISEASEGQVRDLAAQLEQFREVVSRTLPPS